MEWYMYSVAEKCVSPSVNESTIVSYVNVCSQCIWSIVQGVNAGCSVVDCVSLYRRCNDYHIAHV